MSYYDAISYKNLTDLKATATVLFDDLSNDPTGKTEKAELDSFRLDLEKAYEYEKGKEKNGETITQFSKIKDLYGGMLDLLKKKEKLSKDYITEKKTQMMDAFDIAISTENEKIKNE